MWSGLLLIKTYLFPIHPDGLTYLSLLDDVVGVATGETSALQQVHHIVLTAAQKQTMVNIANYPN